MFVQHCKYYWTSTKQTKIKKGQDWRKVNFMEFWCAKSFFMMRRWYQSLAFLNMSLFWGNTFFFPSHERKTYNFQVRSPHSAFKNESFFITELSFAFFLMLITMTCNTWLFIAVVIGRGLGFYLVSPLIKSYVGSAETDDCIDISINLLTTGHQQL